MSRLGVIIDNTYVLKEYINKGGMSVVYLAENVRVGNRWAIKEIVKTDDASNRLFIDALIREANMMKDFDYPAFPRIVDILEDDYALYLVMDYIQGRTLEEILQQEGPQPEERVIGWGIQLCDALAYLHNRPSPIIYRDMKPSNVIMKPDGSLMVIDFGVARVFHPDKAADTVALGTKGFAPPEQYVAQTDERSDIYALGATLRYLLTGYSPYSCSASDYPAIYAATGLSDKMIRILDKCTALNPDERYQSDSELRRALTGEDKPKQRSHKKLWIALLIAAAVVILIGSAAAVYSMIGGKPKTQTIAASTEQTDPQSAVVPDVVGKTFTQAQKLIEDAGLIYQKVEVFDPAVKKDVVISQDKQPNEVLQKGSKIVVLVSLGEEADTTSKVNTAETLSKSSSSQNDDKTSSSRSSNNDTGDSGSSGNGYSGGYDSGGYDSGSNDSGGYDSGSSGSGNSGVSSASSGSGSSYGGDSSGGDPANPEPGGGDVGNGGEDAGGGDAGAAGAYDLPMLY